MCYICKLSTFIFLVVWKKAPAFITKGVKEKAGVGMEINENKDLLLNAPHEDFFD